MMRQNPHDLCLHRVYMPVVEKSTTQSDKRPKTKTEIKGEHGNTSLKYYRKELYL